MLNIFIVHTPFHVFMAEKIVRDIHAKSKSKNVLLLELSPDYKYVNYELWSEIVFLEKIGGSTLGRASFLKSEKNMEIIRKFVVEDMESCIFISDIAWPMNNRVFFDKHLKKKVKYCLFSDGLGTYALPKVTSALFARGLAKSFNGFLNRGVKYKNYLGNQFGLDRKEIISIYAPNVELIGCETSKRKEISFNAAQEVNFDKSKCIFFDTPSWLEIRENEWHLIRENAVNYLKFLNVEKYYYKNHHMGRKEEEIYFEGHGFNIIHTSKCAEQIIAENDFGIVISYLSSSLFNLKCIYHDKIRCISLFSEIISRANGYNDDSSDKVKSLFQSVDVEIIEIL